MAAVAGGPPAMERQESAIVDEEQAHAIFAEYSSGGTTISKDDLADLAFQLGETLSDEELKKVFDDLDTNHDGTVDFKEFYAWLVNPSRESEDKSSYKGRLLQARLAGNYFRRRFKAVGEAMGEGFKVKHDPAYVPLDITVGLGEPGEDAAFEVTAEGSSIEDGPAQPAEGNMCVSFGLVAKAGASDAELGEVAGAIDAILEMAPPGAIPPFVKVSAEVADDLPGDNRGVRVVVAVDQELPAELTEIVDGDFDISALADSVKFRFASTLTPADVVTGDEGVIQDLEAEVSVRGKIQKTALAMAGEASGRLAGAMAGGMGRPGAFRHHGGMGMMMTPLGPMPAGPAMGLMFMGKGAGFLQSMKEITFRFITGNLGEMSEKMGGMAKEMVSEFAGAKTVLPMLTMGVSEMMNDDGAPPPLKDLYRAIYNSIAAFNGVEQWFLGKTYVKVQCKGFELSFLPAVDNM